MEVLLFFLMVHLTPDSMQIAVSFPSTCIFSVELKSYKKG